jgi:glyoxylase-like metal-dependent hydrolase (beta-lactamase superfamily II)
MKRSICITLAVATVLLHACSQNTLWPQQAAPASESSSSASPQITTSAPAPAPAPAAAPAPTATTTAPAPAPKPEAAAQPAQKPAFETRLVEGTNNVYIFRYANVQAMFVVTSAGVIATDPIAYSNRGASQVYLDEIRKITKQPVKYVIYSHHHYDHIAGGKPFKDAGAKFIAHKNAKARLAALKDPHTIIPDEAVGDRKTIKLGGTTLELHYLGLNHSDSTLVMRLPKERVIFTVDWVPVGSLPGRAMIDSFPLQWEQSLKRLMAMDWDKLIPGHPGAPGGRLGTKKDVQDILTFLQEASAEVKTSAQAGKCWDTTEKEVTLPKYSAWPGHATAVPFVVRRYCGLWGRGT